MRNKIFIAGIFAVSLVHAQTLYVNNSDGTFQAIDTKQTHEITFNEAQQLVRFTMLNGITSQFATAKVDNIATTKEKTNELTYNQSLSVGFSENDIRNFNEITQEIPTDELDEEYGDFDENFNPKAITVTFSETGVGTSALPAGITTNINGSHIVIRSTLSKYAYRITGKSSNGSLKIYSDKKFMILAQGVDLTNPTGPAVNIQSGKTVYFCIAKNTTNTFCDGAVYDAPAVVNGIEEDQKGTIFSEGQLIFNGYGDGTGTLNVTSLGGHAICSDDYIRVRGGNINILSSAKDGFRTKDKFIIGRTAAFSPAITINASSNGIECTEGALRIEAGKLDITSAGEAIKVVYEEAVPDPAITPNADIAGGFIKIRTTGEKSSAIQTTGNYTQIGGIIQATVEGNGSKIINSDGTVAFVNGKLTGIAKGTIAEADTTSAGGIKSEGKLNITGGTIALDCQGNGAKAINCNSDIVIDGGEITLLASGDNYTGIADDKKSRAITASTITVNGGKVVAEAYDHAMTSTATITINGGIVNAYSKNATALNKEAVQTAGWLLYMDAE